MRHVLLSFGLLTPCFTTAAVTCFFGLQHPKQSMGSYSFHVAISRQLSSTKVGGHSYVFQDKISYVNSTRSRARKFFYSSPINSPSPSHPQSFQTQFYHHPNCKPPIPDNYILRTYSSTLLVLYAACIIRHGMGVVSLHVLHHRQANGGSKATTNQPTNKLHAAVSF